MNKICFNDDLCKILLSLPKHFLKTNNLTTIFRGYFIRGKAILKNQLYEKVTWSKFTIMICHKQNYDIIKNCIPLAKKIWVNIYDIITKCVY